MSRVRERLAFSDLQYDVENRDGSSAVRTLSRFLANATYRGRSSELWRPQVQQNNEVVDEQWKPGVGTAADYVATVRRHSLEQL